MLVLVAVANALLGIGLAVHANRAGHRVAPSIILRTRDMLDVSGADPDRVVEFMTSRGAGPVRSRRFDESEDEHRKNVALAAGFWLSQKPVAAWETAVDRHAVHSFVIAATCAALGGWVIVIARRMQAGATAPDTAA